VKKPPLAMPCGLSSKFFDHLFSFRCTIQHGMFLVVCRVLLLQWSLQPRVKASLCFFSSWMLFVTGASSNRRCNVVIVGANAGPHDCDTCSCTVDISRWLQTVLSWCRTRSLRVFQLLRSAHRQTLFTHLSSVESLQYFGQCCQRHSDRLIILSYVFTVVDTFVLNMLWTYEYVSFNALMLLVGQDVETYFKGLLVATADNIMKCQVHAVLHSFYNMCFLVFIWCEQSVSHLQQKETFTGQW